MVRARASTAAPASTVVKVRNRARMYAGTAVAGMPARRAASSPADWVCAPVGSRASASSIIMTSADMPPSDAPRPAEGTEVASGSGMPPCLDQGARHAGHAPVAIGEERPSDDADHLPAFPGEAFEALNVAIELPGVCPVLIAVVLDDHPPLPVDQVPAADEPSLVVDDVRVDLGLR